ncbi:MAG TPA: chemotaxis protein CheW [Thermoanaerobaculia bacterium]
MVDLAKIRKKAKKKGGDESTSRPVDESSSTPASEPVKTAPPPAPPLDDSTTRRPDDSPRPLEDSISKLARFKEQAGQRRETRVEQVVEAAQQLELLTFLIAGEQYAIEIEKIVEIVTPRPVTRIPNADPSVVGIISLRGTIVTLVDVRRKLRHPATAPQESSRIVVIDLRTETIGFVVDRVLRVVKIAPSEVEPHPVVHMTELEEAIRGVFRTAGALTILLDLDKLLDHSQWT